MIFPQLSRYPVVCIDVETTGLKWWRDKIFGVAASAPDGSSWYWDVREQPNVLAWLAEELPKCPLIVNHNIKYDAHFLREAGVQLPMDRIDCTMIRAALIDEHLLTYDLDSLGVKYLGIGKDIALYVRLSEMFGGKPTAHAQGANFHRAPSSWMSRYATQDTDTALKLWQWQNKQIEEQELHQVLALERSLLPVIVEMERTGVRVDVELADRAAREIDERSKVLQHDLDKLAGFPINPNPSGSIHKLFAPKKHEDGKRYVLIDGTIANPTESGAPSLDADCLRSMKHPAASMILRLRKMLKTRDTFLRGHILGHHQDGVIHCNYNQTKSDNDRGTGSGRLSVNDPALQQIHKRDEDIASVVRAIFLPDEDCDWVCNDWAQMDFRVFAHYVRNEQILNAYKLNPAMDFHQLVSDMTGIPRKPRWAGDANSKQINLGLIFGMGMGKLAQEMGLPYTEEYSESRGKTWIKPGPETVAVMEKYNEAVPGVQDLLQNASSVAKARGYVRTIMGRRIRFPRGQFTHKAGGLIFQGSAADALKVKLVEVHHYLQSTGTSARLMLNVHDEFDTNVPKGRSDIRSEITRIVTHFDGVGTPIKFRVPILSEQGVGPNWWEACKE